MEIIEEYIKRKKEEIKLNNNRFKVKISIVKVNDDEASNAYVKGKIKDLEELNIPYEFLNLSSSIKEKDLLSIINNLNNNKTITGIIVQMPLPKGIDEEKIKLSIDPKKDIDGFNPLSKYLSATPKGILTYLKDNNIKLESKNALVIGRSNIVGRPMAKALINENMNVTLTHSYTKNKDLRLFIKSADLIICAIGKPNYFKKEDNYEFKKDSIIFDVGISRTKINDKTRLIGDIEENISDNVLFQSPVPKGVGLLTRLALILNLLESYKE